MVDAQGIACSTELIKQSELPTSPSGYNTDREGEQSSREGVVLGCFIRILIVYNDMYPYLVIRHVKGLTLSFHLHHWGPLGTPLGALRDSLSQLSALSTKMSAFGTY